MLCFEPYESHAPKWGLTVFDCSTFWVKDRTLLTEALDVTPEFLRSHHGDSGKMSCNLVGQA
jgi:glutamate/tyrosine decarboxylase-like PLP-dependent enzyme